MSFPPFALRPCAVLLFRTLSQCMGGGAHMILYFRRRRASSLFGSRDGSRDRVLAFTGSLSLSGAHPLTRVGIADSRSHSLTCPGSALLVTRPLCSLLARQLRRAGARGGKRGGGRHRIELRVRGVSRPRHGPFESPAARTAAAPPPPLVAAAAAATEGRQGLCRRGRGRGGVRRRGEGQRLKTTTRGGCGDDDDDHHHHHDHG